MTAQAATPQRPPIPQWHGPLPRTHAPRLMPRLPILHSPWPTLHSLFPIDREMDLGGGGGASQAGCNAGAGEGEGASQAEGRMQRNSSDCTGDAREVGPVQHIGGYATGMSEAAGAGNVFL